MTAVFIICSCSYLWNVVSVALQQSARRHSYELENSNSIALLNIKCLVSTKDKIQPNYQVRDTLHILTHII